MINRGILGAVTLAVAATSVHAFDPPEGLTEGTGGSTRTTGSGGTTVTHSSGSVHCSSGAISSSYTSYEDAYVVAITSAIASACNIDYYPYYDIDAAYDAMSGFAHAYAEAVVEAGASCVSSATGDAKVEGCAYADASAYAWEYAYVDVHAEAAAQAFTDYCTCGGDASAIDWAKGSISQILKADAFANVDVTACVSGNDYALAYGYVDCWADIWAYAVATSLSKAYVYSDYYYNCYSEVAAEAKITVDSWVYESDECTFIEYAEGLTDVNTSGGSGTRVERNH